MADAKQPRRVGSAAKVCPVLREVGKKTNDPEAWSILREMATEWLRLVDKPDH
jgi:hypothetical protein